MTMKRIDVEFTKDGRVHDIAQLDALLTTLIGVTDFFVISHGWNNDLAEQRALYDELLGNVDGPILDKIVPTERHFNRKESFGKNGRQIK